MSNTPRTDANLISICYGDRISHRCAVKADFARELETELADARAEVERLSLSVGELNGSFNARPKCEKCKAKNELIEQMREWFIGACRGCGFVNTSRCDTCRIAKLLSAAERVMK